MSDQGSPTAAPRTSSEQNGLENEAQNKSSRPAAALKLRSISFAGPSTNTLPRSERRSSIQFVAIDKKPTDASENPILGRSPPILLGQPRNRSPPPPRTYHPRVSFDTFNNTSVPDQEFTLICKHNGYTYGRHQRVFLVAIDENSYSEHALNWVIEDMIEDGDEIICIRVVEPDPKAKEGATAAQMLSYKENAQELLSRIQRKNDAAQKKAISIVMEFAVGSVEQTILHMIHIYSPAFLTVGTRGKSLGGIQGLLPGSVSKWCVQNSPVPVVVVRHPEKRRKKMMKRQGDRKRKGYSNIQDQSANMQGSATANTMEGGTPLQSKEGEAEAVALAVAQAVNALDKRPKKKVKAVGKGGNRIMKSRKGRRDTTSVRGGGELVEEGKSESQSEDEREDSEGVEEDSDDDSEDSDDASSVGALYADGDGIEQMPNYVGSNPDENLDDDVVAGLALDNEKDVVN